LDALALFIPNELTNLIKEQLKPFFSATPPKQKWYKYYDPTTNKIYVSRNVVFFENDPYYKDQQADYNAIDFIPMSIPTIHINSRHEDSATGGEGNNLNASADEVPDAPIQPRRSRRIIQTSTRFKDFITDQATYHIQNYLSYDKVKPDFIDFLTNLEESEPKTFHEVNSLPT
jgi:hypothetical protein